MPWIWSDQLALRTDISVSQNLRDTWTQRPVAVWQNESRSIDEVAAALAADDEEPPSIEGGCPPLLAA